MDGVQMMWLILFVLGLGAIAAINVYANEPRSRRTQLISLAVVLFLIAAAYGAVGAWGLALLIAVVGAAEAFRLLRGRRTVA